MRKVSHGSMRKNNRLLVLKTIKKLGPISRADISRLTGLTKSTVSDIVSHFMKLGILKTVGAENRSGVGRKGILIDLNTEDFLVVGYDVGTIRSRIVVTDMKGRVVNKKSFETEKSRIIDQIVEEISSISSGMFDQIVEIGITAPGMIDPKRGVIVHSPNLGLVDFPILEILSKRLKKRLILGHNVKAMMIAELEYGEAKGRSNVLFVNIGPGIGSSFAFDGRLVSGAHNFSGEIGHIGVVEDGEKCRCGKTGCLETVAAAWGIVRRYSRLSGKVLENEYDAKTVAERAKEGDEIAKKVFEEAGKYLGKVLAWTSNILDPELIIIGGGVSRSWDLMEGSFRSEFERELIPPLKGKIEISISKLGEFSTAIGASSIAQEDFLNSLCS